MKIQPAHAGCLLQEDQKGSAIVWFNNGEYGKALPVFQKLCFNFPYDYLIKYYFGACLVETGNYNLDAEKNLILASTNNDVPVKVNYYLGRFYHASGNWNNALRYYNRFKNYSKESEIAGLNIDELCKLCYSQVNPFVAEKEGTAGKSESTAVKDTVTRITPNIVPDITENAGKNEAAGIPEVTDTVRAVRPVSVNKDSDSSVSTNDSLSVSNTGERNSTPSEIKKGRAKNRQVTLPPFINFQINNKVTYLIEDMFQVSEAKSEFEVAAKLEKQLDSLLLKVQNLRKQYHVAIKPAVRDSLAAKIQDQETRNLLLKSEVDRHYNISRKLEQDWWKDADYKVYETYLALRDSMIKLQTVPPVVPEIPDSISIKAAQADTVKTEEIIPDMTPGTKTDSVQEDEISYRIQIGAYDKAIPAQRKLLFNKLEKIRTIDKYINEKGITVYTTGNLKNFEDAVKLQMQVRQEGIKDAFVIEIKDGKRVPLPKEKH